MIIDATVGRQLMQDLGEGNFLLLDIRHPYEYDTGHIPGAVLLAVSYTHLTLPTSIVV